MKLLLSIALFVWIAGVTYFFNSKKANCCTNTELVISPSALASDKALIAFAFDRYQPDTSAYFHMLRDSLVAEISDKNELIITGFLSSMESVRDSLLGLKRANATRALFKGYLNPEQIEISSAIVETISTAPSFEVVANLQEMIASVPMDEGNQESDVVVEKVQPTAAIEPENEGATSVIVTKKAEPSPNVVNEGVEYVVYFKENSSEILSSGEVIKTLKRLEKQVKASKAKLLIEGFDDNSRSEDESLALAKRRTWRVRRLFDDSYVRRKLLVIKNTGQSSNLNSGAEARRVEIRISQ